MARNTVVRIDLGQQQADLEDASRNLELAFAAKRKAETAYALCVTQHQQSAENFRIACELVKNAN